MAQAYASKGFDLSWEAAIRDSELTILNFFNPDIKALNDVTPRPWALMRLEEPLVLVFLYLAFIFVGSFVMKAMYGSQLPPRDEKKGVLMTAALLLYNITQVVLCGYMCITAFQIAFVRNSYQAMCNPFNLKASDMASILHVFYLSKVLDFLDTVFMVFRRKWNQISFLHVYHHASILLIYWLNTSAGYDGDIYITVVLNSFIHFIMYTYYGLAALGVQVPIHLKRLVTHSQRVQFVIMMTQGTLSLVLSCAYPPRLIYLYLLYISTMLLLFTDFDRKAYKSKAKSS
eukprot:gene11313-3350_t